jgi:DNA replication protein DnaC
MRARADGLSEELLKRSNVGRRYWDASISDFSGDDALLTVRGYVKNLRANMKDGWGLYIYGPNGTGKTHLASAVVLKALSEGIAAFALPADLLREEYIERRMFDEYQTVVQRCETVPLLFLDDVGKEYAAKSGWAELVLENLIRKRVREKLPTMITSNLSLKDFRARYQESAFSLLVGSSIPVLMSGEDYRKEQLKTKLAELKNS